LSLHSTGNLQSDEVKEAVNKELDNFGPLLKPKVLQWLDEKESISFENEKDPPTLLEIEKALRNIFSDTAEVIMDWILEELERERKPTNLSNDL